MSLIGHCHAIEFPVTKIVTNEGEGRLDLIIIRSYNGMLTSKRDVACWTFVAVLDLSKSKIRVERVSKDKISTTLNRPKGSVRNTNLLAFNMHPPEKSRQRLDRYLPIAV